MSSTPGGTSAVGSRQPDPDAEVRGRRSIRLTGLFQLFLALVLCGTLAAPRSHAQPTDGELIEAGLEIGLELLPSAGKGAKGVGLGEVITIGIIAYNLAASLPDIAESFQNQIIDSQTVTAWDVNTFKLMKVETLSGVGMMVVDNQNNPFQPGYHTRHIPDNVTIRVSAVQNTFASFPVIAITHLNPAAHISTLSIGANVRTIAPDALNVPSISSIEVPSSGSFHAKEGVLFNFAGTTLVRYPIAKTGSQYFVPSGVKSIGDYAFYGCANLTSVVIPSTVTRIGKDAFVGSSVQHVYFAGDAPSTDSTAFKNRSATLWHLTGTKGWARSFNGATARLYNPFSSRVENGAVTITGMGVWANPAEGRVLMPEEIDGLPVRSIAAEAFYGVDKQYGLTNLVIPNSVTNIGDRAFVLCPDLAVVTMSTNLLSIGEQAFLRCTSLRSIAMPDSLKVISPALFQECTELRGVPLGTNVTSIGENAFWGCTLLNNLSLPKTLIDIGPNAFSFCPSLGISVEVENPMWSSDGIGLFNKGQTKLVKASVRRGGSYTVPRTVVHIENTAFYGSTLSSITVPKSVRSIGINAFAQCTNLTKAFFAGSPPQTDGTAFSGSPNVGVYVVEGAEGWGATYAGAPVLPWVTFQSVSNGGSVRMTSYTGPGGKVIIPATVDGLPVTSVQPGIFSDPGAIESLILPDSVTSIADGTFSGLINLTNLVLGNSVTSIATNAFAGCSALGNVVIPNSVTSIGDGAFSGCGLTNVVIGSGLTRLADNLFKNCQLQSLTIPSTVEHIGAGTFSNNPLAFVVIPDSVKSLGKNAFAGCFSLENAYFQGNAPANDGTAFQGSGHFYDNDSGGRSFAKTTVQYLVGTSGWQPEYGSVPTQLWPLSYSTANGKITITRFTGRGQLHILSSINGVPVTGIADYAFADSQGLTGVTIPAGITHIGAAPFLNCTNLTTVVVAPGNPFYTSVGNVLFNKNMTELKQYPAGLKGSYEIPTSVTTIGAGAFFAARIPQITIPASVSSIGAEAFGLCRKLKSFSVAGGNTAYTASGGALFNSAGTTLIQFPGAATGPYTVPSSVNTIASSAFAGSGVSAVTIPNSVSAIQSGAFRHSRNLTNISVTGGNTQFASANGVLRTTSGTLLAFPGGVAGGYTITDNTGTIASDAFAGSALSFVNVPATVGSVGSRAFAGCAQPMEVRFLGNAPSNDGTAFARSPQARVYYLASGSGWGSEYGGAPTRLVPFQVQDNGNNTLTIVGYVANDTHVEIPENIFGKTVSAIGDEAFEGKENIASVAIPSTVTSIGEGAFRGCLRLRSIRFNNTAHLNVGFAAFEGCRSLAWADFRGTGTATLGHSAFVGCTALADVNFGQVTHIGDYAFSGCTRLAYVSLGDSVQTIGAYAFANLGLTQIVLPASVQSIGSHAFAGAGRATGFASVYTYGNAPASDGTAFANSYATIFYTQGTAWGASYNGMQTMAYPSSFNFTISGGGATITSLISGGKDLLIPAFVFGPTSVNPVPVVAIGPNAFSGNVTITNITIPESVTTIGSAAFRNCTNLLTAALPANLASIGAAAFQNCVKLRGISIPQSVTNIGDFAFSGCPGETNLTFGATLAYLGVGAFTGWTNLQTVYFAGNAPTFNGSPFSSAANPTIRTLPGATGWGATLYGKPLTQWIQYIYRTNGNGTISLQLYQGTQTVVTVPSVINGRAVTDLESTTFQNDRHVSSVILPNSITHIWSEAFKYSGVRNIVLGTNLQSIGYRAFFGTPLQSVVLPDSVTELEDNAFEFCGLTNVVLPQNLVSIGNYAFADTLLTNINLPHGLQSIGERAFDNVPLAAIAFPQTLRTIGTRAFFRSPLGDSVTLPASVTHIGGEAFAWTDLQAVYFEGNAPSAGHDPFSQVETRQVINGRTFKVGSGIAYYTPATYGWGADYHGLQTKPWHPYSYTIDGSSVTITGYQGSGGVLAIPDRIGGLSVTAIAAHAFASNSTLIQLTIPSTITSIGTGAFAQSSNLQAVYFRGNAPTVGSDLFAGNNTQVFYLDSATGWASSFGGVNTTPYPATGAVTVHITPNTIGAKWQVDGGAFHDGGATVTNIPVGSRVISFSTVAGWHKPNSVTVQVPAFDGTILKLPYYPVNFNYVTNGDGSLTITGYTGTNGTVYIPEKINGVTVSGIAANAFTNSSITSVVLHDAITSIGANAFAGSQNLVSATIGSGITTLPSNVFANCPNLVSVFFNGNAPAIDGTIFTGSPNVSVYYLSTGTGWAGTFGGRPALTSPYTVGVLADNTLWITAYNGPGGKVEIPARIGGLAVSGIYADVFKDNLTLTEVIIPDTVNKIEFAAFSGCSNLQTVVLGTNMQSIGFFAFANCASLSRINFPASLLEINRGAFQNCNLTNVALGENLGSIGQSAFSRCENLTELTFGNSLTNIGQGAFSWTKVRSVTFPASLQSIEGSAFSSCSELTNVVFRPNLTSIGESAFASTKLTSIVLPEKVYLGSLAFAHCSQLQMALWTGTPSVALFNKAILSPFFNSPTVLYYPSSSAAYGGWLAPDIAATDYRAAVAYRIADEGGSAGPSVTVEHFAGKLGIPFTIPSTIDGRPVTAVAENALSTYIGILDVPAGIVSIGTMRNPNFGVSVINVDAANAYYTSDDGILYDKAKTTLICFPAGKNAFGSFTVPESVTTIADHAFRGSRLSTLTFSPNLSVIGAAAFAGASIASVVQPAPDMLSYLGEGAFEGCAALTSFNTGNNLAAVQPRTFAGCGALTSITLGQSIGTIGEEAFLNCAALGSVSFPAALGTIEDSAFRNCQSLTTLILPAGVQTGAGYFSIQLGSGAFAGCTGLTSAYFLGHRPEPQYLDVFEGDTQLTVYYLGDSLGWSSSYGGRPAAPYSPFGALQVSFTPLIDAHWQVDGGDLQANGATVSPVSVGARTITFTDEIGYVTPSPITVGITNQTLTTASAAYKLAPVVFTVNSGSITITGVRELNEDGFLVVPATINGMPVTSIGDGAFFNNQSIYGVILPSTITNIGNTSFYGCSNIRQVILSTNLVSIGHQAFSGCSSLYSVQIPDSVTTVGQGAFGDCANLSTAQIGSGLAQVGVYTFVNSGSLQTLFFTGNAPSDASSLTTYYPQVSKLYYLPGAAAWDALTSGSPTDWTSLFTYGTNASGGIVITSMREGYWFPGICVPPTFNGAPVTEIGDYAFMNHGPSGIELPRTITRIGEGAFSPSNVRSLFFSQSITHIGENAFKDCWGLLGLFVHPANPAYSSAKGILYNKARTELLAVSRSAPFTENGLFQIPGSVISIADYALTGAEAITQLNIPASVASIGKQALSGMYYLTNITVDPGNGHFYTDANALFDKDTTTLIQFFGGVSAYTVPATVRTIGDGAFLWKDQFTAISLPAALTRIGEDAFMGAAIGAITIPTSVTNIGRGAFAYNQMQELALPPGMTTIPANLCVGCESLTKVVIPSTVTNIGSSAFNATRLEEVAWPTGLTHIGDFAFSQTRLTTLVLPDQLRDIGKYAFFACQYLTSVTLGANVTNIDEAAFYNNGSLRTVNFNQNLRTIGAYAFNAVQWIGRLVFPSSLESIGDQAFTSLQGASLLFLGDAPEAGGTIFNSGTVYYLNGTSGWGATFSGRSTAPYESLFSYEENGDGTATITGSDLNWGDVYFPAQWGGRSVTGIAAGTFDGRAFGTIHIPASIVNIEPAVFTAAAATEYVVDAANPAYTTVNGSLYNAALTQLIAPANRPTFNLPATVMNVDPRLFALCTELGSISVNSSNPAYSSFGGVMFNKSTNILVRFPAAGSFSSYDVPAFVNTIGEQAFSGARVGAVRIPGSVTNLQARAFAGCPVRGVYFEGSAPTIDPTAFEGTFRTYTFYLPPGTAESFAAPGVTAQEWLSLFNYVTNGSSIAIEGYNNPGNQNYVLFPRNGIYGKPITEIGASFANHWLTGIQLPDGVTQLVNGAFMNAELIDVRLPANLTSIGNNAFEGCDLRTVNLPQSLSSIGEWAFAENSLETIVFPAALKRLETGAFFDNPLVSVTFNNGLLDIGESAFEDGRLVDINLPNTLTNIGPAAFAGNQLRKLTIPPLITHIAENAFQDNYELSSLSLPVGVVDIGDYAFADSNLRSLNIPAGVTNIGAYAFSDAELSTLTLPTSLISVGESAFGGSFLSSLIVPPNVQSIGNNAFAYNELMNVYFLGNAPANDDGTALMDNYPDFGETKAWYLPGTSGWASTYGGVAAEMLGSAASSVLNNGDGTLTLASYLGAGSTVVPASVNGSPLTIVGPGAFERTGYLINEITLSSGITTILSGAFRGCPGVTTIYIPSTVTSIASDAFVHCSALTNIVVAAENPMFSSAGGILFDKEQTTILAYGAGRTGAYHVPANVTTIGDYAFMNVRGLTSIVFPDGLTSIGQHAFDSCDGLTSVSIPSSASLFGSNAFASCENLVVVYFRGDAPLNDGTAFAQHSGMTSYYLPGTAGFGSSYGGAPAVELQPPTAASYTVQRSPGLPVSVSVSDLAALWSDANSAYPVTLKWVAGASTNGGSVAVSGGVITYNNTNHVNDAVIYMIANSLGIERLGVIRIVRVDAAPSIVTQPRSQLVTAGLSGNLSVQARGTAPLTYQWYYQGAPISGANSSTLRITGMQQSQSGRYHVVVSNALGSQASSDAFLTVADGPPVIVIQPLNRSVNAGSSATFAAHVAGTDPRGFQWLFNGAPIAGANAASLVVPNAQQENVGAYSLVVSNQFGTATSSNAVLSVTDIAPVIVSRPRSTTAVVGSDTTFTVSAVGTTPMTAQWLFNGNVIPGATDTTLTITNVQTSHLGFYTVVVSNRVGTTGSPQAYLGVNVPATITSEPTAQSVVLGGTATFRATAVGTTPVSYQWRFNGNDIAGATRSTLTLTNVQQTAAGIYSIVASNSFGTDMAEATLSVLEPIFRQQPRSRTNEAGTAATFSVSFNSTAAPSFQWYHQGAALVGQTNYVLVVWDVQQANAGAYHVVLSNSFGVARSVDAELTVVPVAPVILAQPASVTNAVTTSAHFRVNARGTKPMTYQWQFNGADITGATNSTYVRTNVTTSDAGVYSVIVSNDIGSTPSEGATLTVNNAFVPLTGSYNGLFYDTNEVAHHSSGFITLSLAASGGHSGRFLLEGITNRFNGRFDGNGFSRLVVPRTNATPLIMTLQLDLTDNTDRLVGEITDGIWTARMIADRAVFNSTNSTTLAGRYTMTLPGSGNAVAPAGYSPASIIVYPYGAFYLTGSAADGAALGQTVAISKNGQVPFYVSLYGGKGSMLGWLQIHDTAQREITGNVSWIKKAAAEDYYSAGFTNVAEVIGAGYVPPASGVRALNLTNAWVVLEGGNLPAASTNQITWSSSNTLTVSAPNPYGIRLFVSPTSGNVSGSFVHPVTGRSTSLRGVLLQESDEAGGYFLGPNQSGQMLILP